MEFITYMKIKYMAHGAEIGIDITQKRRIYLIIFLQDSCIIYVVI